MVGSEANCISAALTEAMESDIAVNASEYWRALLTPRAVKTRSKTMATEALARLTSVLTRLVYSALDNAEMSLAVWFCISTLVFEMSKWLKNKVTTSLMFLDTASMVWFCTSTLAAVALLAPVRAATGSKSSVLAPVRP